MLGAAQQAAEPRRLIRRSYETRFRKVGIWKPPWPIMIAGSGMVEAMLARTAVRRPERRRPMAQRQVG